MFDMNANQLGAEIKRLRKIHKMSQKELASGICTQPAISGIESGKVYPSIDILYLLSIRLRVSMDYFLKILLNDSSTYIEDTKEHIDELLKNKDYQEIYELCKFELQQLKHRNMNFTFTQFIKWCHSVSSYYLGIIKWKKCIEELNNLLDDSHLLTGHKFQD
ncbi:hypothetical protein CU633_10065 [Bacillus sp. V3-13]|uniref:helix-turn-helix domain-containing protein n=1 Tax=Bacillus sp. V3-13 TaxID=2053728 RepID=UPI000C76EE40|nr:helix-turn-helix domain-containing protein [Bacillus sp. V3-13]PLR77534.1 hypothetical protein CU633_10065 [Bacillus sp. V3-13]